jgi:hypothetical protein
MYIQCVAVKMKTDLFVLCTSKDVIFYTRIIS